jgi:hypothetical protein
MNTIPFPSGLDIWITQQWGGRSGEEAAIRREDLLMHAAEYFPGVRDTDIRLAIQSLRENGWMICNQMSGNGYFPAKSVQEYDEFRTRYIAKARTIEKIVRAMDVTAKRTFDYAPDQMKLF